MTSNRAANYGKETDNMNTTNSGVNYFHLIKIFIHIFIFSINLKSWTRR
jgi:hypothetical protein